MPGGPHLGRSIARAGRHRQPDLLAVAGRHGTIGYLIGRPAIAAPPLILLGGTFDPPHIGHLVLAECARVQLKAGRVVFLPAGNPYRKGQREVTPAADRLALTRLAIEGNTGFVLDDREVRRPGPTYTVDTLEELHAEGHREIVLILGGDAIADMPNWKTPARILELARIATGTNATPPGAGFPVLTIDMPPLPISSTLIRERVAGGKPIRYLVPDAVERYIREHRLYL